MVEKMKCDHCDTELVKKEKEGKSFYVCPNWKPDGSGCQGTVKFSSKKKGASKKENNDNGDVEIWKLRILKAILKELKELRADLKMKRN